jgi:hypothetical protein
MPSAAQRRPAVGCSVCDAPSRAELAVIPAVIVSIVDRSRPLGRCSSVREGLYDSDHAVLGSAVAISAAEGGGVVSRAIVFSPR